MPGVGANSEDALGGLARTLPPQVQLTGSLLPSPKLLLYVRIRQSKAVPGSAPAEPYDYQFQS